MHLKSKKGPRSTSFQPSQPLIFAPFFPSWLAKMRFIDILSLVISFLGIYGIIFSLRLLLPRNIVPGVKTLFTEVMALLEHAEANNIPNVRDYRANLAMCVHVLSLPSNITPTDRTQPPQPISTNAHGEPSLSRVLPAVVPPLTVGSDLEALQPQMADRNY